MVGYGTVRYGMLGHGMAWHGMAWHGMAWHVIVYGWQIHHFYLLRTDAFRIHVGEIGDIRSVRIRQDNSKVNPSWFLVAVSVKREINWIFLFTISQNTRRRTLPGLQSLSAFEIPAKSNIECLNLLKKLCYSKYWHLEKI